MVWERPCFDACNYALQHGGEFVEYLWRELIADSTVSTTFCAYEGEGCVTGWAVTQSFRCQAVDR